MLNIEIDDEKFNKKLERVIKKLLPEAVKAGLTEAAQLVEDRAIAKCPVDDGYLQARITHEVTNDNAIIGTVVEYAPYVHEGTGIYASAKRGRHTAWSFIDSKGVKHTIKGQKPNPFLQKAAEEKRGDILKCFENKLGDGNT